MFLVDTEAGDVGIPLSRLVDREFGDRQDDFRRRVQDSKLTTRSFASPDMLQLLVERSLRELADTGVVADTRRLLGIVTAHDHSGILPALDPD